MSRRTQLLWRKGRVDYRSKPATPAAPVASNVTASGVTMTWSPVAGADAYRLQRSLDAVTWTDAYLGPNLTAVLSGLTAATLYHFRVAASSGAAVSDWSATTDVTTATTAAPPATPAAPTASNITANTATLSWTPVATATGYTLQRSPNGTTGWATMFTGPGLSFNDSGLAASTPYWYRLSASNADGTSAYSTSLTFTTTAAAGTPPATPAAPTVVSTGETNISLSWVAVATATAYTLQHSLTGVAPWTTVYTGPALAYNDVGLDAETRYWYRLSASNAAGASAQSASAQGVTTAAVPNVQPISGRYIVARAGVVTHPNFNTATDVYQGANADAIVARIASMGMSFFRGQFPADTLADDWAAACRTHGVKWLMTVCPEGVAQPTDQTLAETATKIRRIRDGYADVCYGIEGINEPNHNRSGAPVPPAWAQQTVDQQQVIWETAKANLTGGAPSPIAGVMIVGPSLHDVATDNSYTQASPSGGRFHYEQLVDAGILAFQNEAGLHTYPGGSYPIRKLDGRLAHIYTAYGAGYPVSCTEWGYHNALQNSTGGHPPASEEAAGTYGPRGFLQFITTVHPDGIVRGPLRLTEYELLDDFDAPPKDIQENNFGMYRVSDVSGAQAVLPSTWSPKPIVTKVGTLLTACQDPVGQAAYTPQLVTCDVSSPSSTAALQWQVVATKAQADVGAAMLFVWRDKDVWNAGTSTAITVLPVTVNVRDRVGTRSFQVDGEVLRVDLR